MVEKLELYVRYCAKKNKTLLILQKNLIQQQNAKDVSRISVSDVAFCDLAVLQVLQETLNQVLCQ